VRVFRTIVLTLLRCACMRPRAHFPSSRPREPSRGREHLIAEASLSLLDSSAPARS